MLAQEWVDDFNSAARTYSRERRESPVVKVTFGDGSTRYAQKIEAGPSNHLVTLDLFPEADDVLANMVAIDRNANEGGGTDYFAREAVVIDPGRIVMVELLYERPHGRAVGFAVPDA